MLAEIGAMQKEQITEVADAALAVNDRRGNFEMTQTIEKMHTGSVSIWSGFWGL